MNFLIRASCNAVANYWELESVNDAYDAPLWKYILYNRENKTKP